MTSPLPVTIVIVSYNCRDVLWECLYKLTAKSGNPPILVVDNASSDGSAGMVAKEFPAVRLIKNTSNRGFAAACNQGIRACPATFILLLNPDTLLKYADLQKLYELIRARPDVGVCGPRILNPDGSLQPSCRAFPMLGAMIGDELGLSRLFPRSQWLSRYRMHGWAHDETREVDQLMGSCLLVRRTALEQVGLLDEQFFLYFEEVDLCWRIRQVGWRVVFVADATVTHVGGASSKTNRREALGHRYRSLFAFYRKHYPRWQLPVLRCVVQLAALLRVLAGQRDYWPIAKQAWKL